MTDTEGPNQAVAAAKDSDRSAIPLHSKTPAQLARAANSHHGQCLRHGSEMVEHAIRAGEALLAAKDKVGHGRWEAWLEKNCAAWRSQAPRYMKLARQYRDRLADPARAPDLPRSIRHALALLTNPGRKTETASTSEVSAAAGVELSCHPHNSRLLHTSDDPPADTTDDAGSDGDPQSGRKRKQRVPRDGNQAASVQENSKNSTPSPRGAERGSQTDEVITAAMSPASGQEDVRKVSTTPDAKLADIDSDLLVAVEVDAAQVVAEIIEAIQDAANCFCRRKSAIRRDAVNAQRAILAVVRQKLASFLPGAPIPPPASAPRRRRTHKAADHDYSEY